MTTAARLERAVDRVLRLKDGERLEVARDRPRPALRQAEEDLKQAIHCARLLEIRVDGKGDEPWWSREPEAMAAYATTLAACASRVAERLAKAVKP